MNQKLIRDGSPRYSVDVRSNGRIIVTVEQDLSLKRTYAHMLQPPYRDIARGLGIMLDYSQRL